MGTCDLCEKGLLQPMTGSGRTFKGVDGNLYDVPADLALLTCTHCGGRLLWRAELEALADVEGKVSR